MSRFFNPFKYEAGNLAAWYLFVQLGRPFENDYDKFHNVLFKAITRNKSLYKKIAIPKRKKGKRIILIPHPDLMYIQKLINKNILVTEPCHPSAYGFSGGNVVQCLTKIASMNQPIFTADVKDAFPNTMGKTVFNLFMNMEFGFYASYFLTCLTTWYRDGIIKYDHYYERYDIGLPQGAPTSPRLFDLAFEYFDKKFAKIAKRVDGCYVRYADNLFFSAPTFWPHQVIKHYVEGSTSYLDSWGTRSWKNYAIQFETIPEGVAKYEIYDNGWVYWHSPLISAIFNEMISGYVLRPDMKPSTIYYKFEADQNYHLHKAFLADQGKIFHALGLNIINGQLHNTRKFKRNLRMTIYNLQKALAQQGAFENDIWPLYLKANGMMNWAIAESLPSQLLADWEKIDYEIFSIRYSGPSGTWQKEIENY